MRSPILKSLLLSLTISTLSLLASNQLFAQTQPLTRTSHINDFATVVDQATGVRLENILENLQRKTGVQFDVATVKTLSGQDIFEFSKALARDWNVGARTSAHKSLLLVIAVDEKTAFTQFSKSVQPDLPEGSLGEMGQRMRVLLTE